MPPRAVRTKHQLVAGLEAELMRRIRKTGGLSRMELARELSLAPSTAGIYVDRLKHEGFLLETDKVARGPGRRPTLLQPNPAVGRFVGLDFEAHSLSCTVVDFALRTVARTTRAISPEGGRDRVLQRMADAVAAAIKGSTAPLLGVGVGVPGIIDAERGTASYYEYVEGWNDVPIMEYLSGRFGVPVHVENNLRAMAMAELWLGQGRGLRNFICFAVRTGIGVGVVLNGELFGGSGGASGEIGAWPVLDPSARRRTKAPPTLESAASLQRILETASAAAGRSLNWSGLQAAVRMGDRAVQDALDDAAAIHARAIAQLYLLIDPERIILVGPLADLGSAMLTPILVNLRPRFDGSVPVLVNSTFGQFGGALGAAALAGHRWKPVR